MDDGARLAQGQERPRRLQPRGGAGAASACAGRRRSRSRRSSGCSRPPRPRSRSSRRPADGTRVRLTLDQRPRGWAALRRRSSCARAAKRQAGRGARGLDELLVGPGLMRWWGWGERRPRRRAARSPPRRCCARSSGVDPAARRLPVALEDGALSRIRRCPRRRASGWWRWSARRTCATTREARVGHAVGQAAIPIWSGSAPATRRARRTPWSLPGSAEQVAAVLARVRGAPGGGGAVRRRHERGGRRGAGARTGSTPRSSLDLGRLDRHGGGRPDARSPPPRRRPARAGGRGAARRRGRDARPLPAVVRVLDRRRLGGHALGRPGVHGLRADRRARARRCAASTPVGEIGTRAVPAQRRRAEPSRAARGLRGRARRDREATVRVRPAPAFRRYEGWSFARFAEGCDAFRVMEQAEASADVARLSDEAETGAVECDGVLREQGGGARAALSAPARPRARLHGHPRVRGRGGGRGAQAARTRPALLRAGGGMSLGPRPGEAWLRGRYSGPYLRDELLDRGVMVETLETATSWSQPASSLHAAVADALRKTLGERGTPAARDVPRVAPLPVGRLALLHLPGAPGGRRDGAVAGGEDRRVRGDHGGRRHDHAPPRDRPRPRAVDARGGGRAGNRADARGEGDGSTPPGS